MATKEEILAAARKKRNTKVVELGAGATVTMTELSEAERKALYIRLYVADSNGDPTRFDNPPSKGGKADPEGKYWHYREGVNYRKEYLRACMSPNDFLDELLAADVAESVKNELLRAAEEVNGIKSDEEIAKN